MPIKSSSSNKTVTYELVMSHEDLRDMINDPNVAFVEPGCPSAGNISVNQMQDFEIVVKRAGGAELGLPFLMKRTDSLVVRFSQKKIDSQSFNLGDIDVIPCYQRLEDIPLSVKEKGESVLLCDGTRVLFPTPTQTPTTSGLVFTWTKQPVDQSLSSTMNFYWEYAYQAYSGLTVSGGAWKRSDDNGASWSNITDETITLYSSMSLDQTVVTGGGLMITNPGTYVPGRKYRYEVLVNGVLTTTNMAGVILSTPTPTPTSTPTPTPTPTSTPTPTATA